MNSITRSDHPQHRQPDATSPQPTRISGLIFAAKAAGLRSRRRLADTLAPLPKLGRQSAGTLPFLLAESVTALWSDPRQSEFGFQFGKVENLRVAARHFDGLVIPEGGVFSFWRQLGRPSRARGFVAADSRVVRGGVSFDSRRLAPAGLRLAFGGAAHAR
jgi:hypothetical protein